MSAWIQMFRLLLIRISPFFRYCRAGLRLRNDVHMTAVRAVMYRFAVAVLVITISFLRYPCKWFFEKIFEKVLESLGRVRIKNFKKFYFSD